jgi:hypothetical protein
MRGVFAVSDTTRVQRSAASLPKRATCAGLDLLILLVLVTVLSIIITGGGTIHLAGSTIRARGVENPIWILTALVLLRYALGDCPVLGARRWPVAPLLQKGMAFVVGFPPAVARRFRRPVVALAIVAVMVFCIRVSLAWASPGFFSGDDVEIHEMTLGVLLGRPWPVWSLRCAFFPMTFVYPAQWLATQIGWSSTEILVLAGRSAVALVSTAAIPLVWYVGRHLEPDEPRVAALGVFLLAINKLQMSFGSSELPRPVSTVFVLAAFLYAMKNTPLRSAVAGLLLGTAVAFRFSEAVFIPAALVTIPRGRYTAHASLLVIFAAGAAAAIIGLSDLLYWGHPFSSLVAAVDYSIVRQESSRGYEPPWEYLTIIPTWSTYVFIALAVVGSSRRAPEGWWLWLPIGILSVLPHKESRYLLPVIPFLCIAGARGFLRFTACLQQSTAVGGWRQWTRDLAAPLLLLAVLHEVGGWRLPRSDEGVRLAEHLRAAGIVGLAAQESWRLGGRPYLWPLEPVTELSSATLANVGSIAQALKHASFVALRSRVARTVGDPSLQAHGYIRDPAWHGEDYVLYAKVR